MEESSLQFSSDDEVEFDTDDDLLIAARNIIKASEEKSSEARNSIDNIENLIEHVTNNSTDLAMTLFEDPSSSIDDAASCFGSDGSTQEFLIALYILMFNNVFQDMLKVFWPLTDDNEKYEDIRRIVLSILFSNNEENVKQLLGDGFTENVERMREDVKLVVMETWRVQRDDVLSKHEVLTDAVHCGLTKEVAEEFTDDFSLVSVFPADDVEAWCRVISQVVIPSCICMIIHSSILQFTIQPIYPLNEGTRDVPVRISSKVPEGGSLTLPDLAN